MKQTQQKIKEVAVDAALCKSCGYCEAVCPKQIFKRSDTCNAQGYPFMEAVNGGDCIGCLRCAMICPDFAIRIREMEA